MPSKQKYLPILIVLFVCVIIGIFTFQAYGMTWDEYLYYQYGEAIGYAYSIPARMSGDFDLDRAYGPSVGDHRNRGPAYLLLSRIPVLALHDATGIDIVDLWHLVNFIAFLVGVYYLYLLALRWLKPASAFWTALLYLTQPLLWGHGFINPKDPPFATIFIINIYYGFKMVDQFEKGEPESKQIRLMLLVGVLLGIATNLRIIAPFIAALIVLYALLKGKWWTLPWFIRIGVVAAFFTYVTWPYLWSAPVKHFIEVLTLMSHNPTQLKVLFYGTEYRAFELPLRYLPYLLGATLTEPVWILFSLGMGSATLKVWKKELDWKSLSLIVLWFVIMLGYVLAVRPPMYDGFRHFLFILPPVFILAGFGIEQLGAWIKRPALQTLLMLGVLAFGVRGIIALYPYEYAYYNQFVGGVSGVQGNFETEYWLTCYKEAMRDFEALNEGQETPLIIYREERNAAYYATPNIQLVDKYPLEPGDYLLLSARLDEVHAIQKKSPNVVEVGRDGATFCAIREIAP